MKGGVYLLLATFMIMSLTQTVSAQQDLLVHVVTPDGVGKAGLEVRVASDETTQVFVANGTGWAIFKNLSPARYNISIYLGSLLLNSTLANFPDTSQLTLTAPLGNLTVRVGDLAGRPVRNIAVRLSAAVGQFEKTQETDSNGITVFKDLPFTTVRAMGGHYRLESITRTLVVGQKNFTLETLNKNESLTVKLLNLNMTVTNLEGQAPTSQLNVRLASGKFNTTLSLAAGGRGVATGMVSSEIVGPYNITVTSMLFRREIKVYEEQRSLTGDASLTLVADLGALAVRVLDESGEPVPKIGVLFSSVGTGNFTALSTDENGKAELRDLPLSTTEAGKYSLYFFRARTPIGRLETELTASSQTVQFTISLMKVTFSVVDSSGQPIIGANITTTDPLTGRRISTITEQTGQAVHRVFAGPNLVEIFYKGVKVFGESVNVESESHPLVVSSVNFRVTVRVLDALNAIVQGLDLMISANNTLLYSGRTTEEPVSVLVGLPSIVTVDLREGDMILSRETVFVSRPTTIDMRMQPFVAAGGSLIRVDDIVLTLSVIMLAGTLLYLARTLVARQR